MAAMTSAERPAGTDGTREPSRSVQVLLATLTPLAAILAAFVLAAGYAPLGLFLPLALFVFNVVRQVRGVALHGPSAWRIMLITVNGAFVAFIIIWMLRS